MGFLQKIDEKKRQAGVERLLKEVDLVRFVKQQMLMIGLLK
jgi:hypothetical protein